MESHLRELLEKACSAGATEASFFSPMELVVEEQLADYCVNLKCENYGLSPGCPPHVKGPEAFRHWQDAASYALALRIDVDPSILFSEERSEVLRLLHEAVSVVELAASAMSFKRSKGFAGGCCKKLFCKDHADCQLLTKTGKCRNPQHARPSMSGFGVNVTKMMQAAGWPNKTIAGITERGEDSGWVAGLVLITK